MINKNLRIRNLGNTFCGKPLQQQRNRFLAMGAVALLTGTIATAISACDGHSSLGIPISSGGNAGSGAVGGAGGTTTGGFGGTTSGGSAGFGGEGAHAGEGGVGGQGGSAGSGGQGGFAGEGGVGGQGGIAGAGGSAGFGGQGGGTVCSGVFNQTVTGLTIAKTSTEMVGGYGFTYVSQTTGGINMDVECSSDLVNVASDEMLLNVEKLINVPGDSRRLRITVTSRNTFNATCNITVENL